MDTSKLINGITLINSEVITYSTNSIYYWY